MLKKFINKGCHSGSSGTHRSVSLLTGLAFVLLLLASFGNVAWAQSLDEAAGDYVVYVNNNGQAKQMSFKVTGNFRESDFTKWGERSQTVQVTGSLKANGNVTAITTSFWGYSGTNGPQKMCDLPSNGIVYAYKNINSKDRYICVQITSIAENGFKNCTNLTTVSLPTSVFPIGNSAFEGCTSLTSVTLPSSVTSIGNSAFKGCTKLSKIGDETNKIKFASSITIGENAFESVATSGQASSFTLDLTNVTSIGNSAFIGSKVSQITNIATSIPESAFQNCTSLTSVTTLPSFVHSIGNFAFKGCTKLIKIGNTDNTISFANAITIGESAFENVGTGVSAFFALDLTNVTSIGKAAFKGSRVQSISNIATAIPESAFQNCTYLNTIGSTNNTIKFDNPITIGESAFESVGTNQWVPSFTLNLTNVTSIGKAAFKGCTKLLSVTFPTAPVEDNNPMLDLFVPTFTEIPESAFQGCTSLNDVVVPDNVTTLGKFAFDGCTSLSRITFGTGVTGLPERIFNNIASNTHHLDIILNAPATDLISDNFNKEAFGTITHVGRAYPTTSAGNQNTSNFLIYVRDNAAVDALRGIWIDNDALSTDKKKNYRDLIRSFAPYVGGDNTDDGDRYTKDDQKKAVSIAFQNVSPSVKNVNVCDYNDNTASTGTANWFTGDVFSSSFDGSLAFKEGATVADGRIYLSAPQSFAVNANHDATKPDLGNYDFVHWIVRNAEGEIIKTFADGVTDVDSVYDATVKYEAVYKLQIEGYHITINAKYIDESEIDVLDPQSPVEFFVANEDMTNNNKWDPTTTYTDKKNVRAVAAHDSVVFVRWATSSASRADYANTADTLVEGAVQHDVALIAYFAKANVLTINPNSGITEVQDSVQYLYSYDGNIYDSVVNSLDSLPKASDFSLASKTYKYKVRRGPLYLKYVPDQKARVVFWSIKNDNTLDTSLDDIISFANFNNDTVVNPYWGHDIYLASKPANAADHFTVSTSPYGTPNDLYLAGTDTIGYPISNGAYTVHALLDTLGRACPAENDYVFVRWQETASSIYDVRILNNIGRDTSIILMGRSLFNGHNGDFKDTAIFGHSIYVDTLVINNPKNEAHVHVNIALFNGFTPAAAPAEVKYGQDIPFDTLAEGQSYMLSASVDNSDYHFVKWQYSTDFDGYHPADANWVDSASLFPTFVIPADKFNKNYRFRAVFDTNHHIYITTNCADVEGSFSVNGQAYNFNDKESMTYPDIPLTIATSGAPTATFMRWENNNGSLLSLFPAFSLTNRYNLYKDTTFRAVFGHSLDLLGNTVSYTVRNNETTLPYNPAFNLFECGSELTIVATPDEHHTFVQWRWDAGSNVTFDDQNQTATIDKFVDNTILEAEVAPKFYIARFQVVGDTFVVEQNPFTLQPDTIYNSSVTVSDRRGTFTHIHDSNRFVSGMYYGSGYPIQATAVPGRNYHFVNWTNTKGTLHSTENPITIDLAYDDTIFANFSIDNCNITVLDADVNVEGDPKGSAEANRSSMFYGDDDNPIVITAEPADHYHFAKWVDAQGNNLLDLDGNDISTINPASIVLKKNMTVKPVFEPDVYTVHLTQSAHGSIACKDDVATMTYDDYLEGVNPISVIATPDNHYHLLSWTITPTTNIVPIDQDAYPLPVVDNPKVLPINGDVTVSAVFEANRYTLTVRSNNDTYGTAAIDEDNASMTIEDLTPIKAVATPNLYHDFVDWKDNDGAVIFDTPEIEVSLTSDSTLTAYFEPHTYTFTAIANANGKVEDDDRVDFGMTMYDSQSITAVANEHYKFVNWTNVDGDVVATDATLAVKNIISDSTIYANFDTIQYHIVIPTLLGSHGTVTVEPQAGSIDDPVTLIATPEEHYEFVNWVDADGNDLGSDNPLVIKPSKDMTITANFRGIMYYATIASTNTAFGSVAPASGSMRYADAKHIIATATANEHYYFVNWTDADNNVLGTAETIDLNLSSDSSVFANFAPMTYHASIAVNGNGSVATDPADAILYGQSITATATPAAHHHFVNWTNANGQVISTDNPIVLALESDSAISANFAVNVYHVTFNPAEHGNVFCEPDYMPYGGQLLTAVPQPEDHYHFVFWTDEQGDVIYDNPMSLDLDRDRVFTPHFAIDTHSVALFANEGGSVSGNGNYIYGSTVTITATPATCYDFVKWSDGNTDATRQFVITRDTAFSAVFNYHRYAGDEYQDVCDAYTWPTNDSTYLLPGIYSAVVPNSLGCDSIATLHLTLRYSTSAQESMVACDQYTWTNDVTYTETGVYSYTITNAQGCDSVRTLHLTVNSSTHNVFYNTVCDSYNWRGAEYTETGVYEYDYTNTQNCPSTDTLHLTVKYSTALDTTATVCDSYRWTNGITYTESGVYSYTITNAQGCDSVRTLHLTVNYSTAAQESQVSCESYTWTNGQTYTETGVYSYTTTNAQGCDSVRTLHLTINHGTVTYDSYTACDSYTWHGTTYTTSGYYTYNYLNVNNCPSSENLTLTVNYSTHNADNAESCESYTWHGADYTATGVYTYNYNNAAGCYSTDTLHLTIYHGTHFTETVTACNSYTWNDQTYTVSGTYLRNYFAEHHCASTDTLHLTIHYSTHETEAITACDSYTWHGNVYNTTGTFEYDYTNAQGCPSTDTLFLTLFYGTHNNVVVTACDEYTWHDVTYNANGNYTYNYVNDVFCPSTDTLHLTIKHSVSSNLSLTVCDQIMWDETLLTESGDYSFVYTAANGCDSTLFLHLTVNESSYNEIYDADYHSYTWNGQTYYQSGDYTQTFTNAVGCDSVVVLHLNIMNYDVLIPEIVQRDGTEIVVNHYPHGTDQYTDYITYRWYCDGVLIQEGSDDTYKNADNSPLHGCYHVEVPNNSTRQVWVSSNTLCFGVGIDDVETNNFNIYPSPVQAGAMVTVTSDLDASALNGASIKVYSVNGALLNSYNFNEHGFTAPATAGMYLVNVIGADGKTLHTARIVVK